MIKSIKNIFQTHKSYDLVSATTDSNMEKELHDEVKKGITLKRTESVDKSAPITQAEIEEAPSASIDENLKKEIKKGILYFHFSTLKLLFQLKPRIFFREFIFIF